MQWLRYLLTTISILAILCLTAFVTYNIAFGMGEAKGHDKGYTAGQKVGYSSGKTDGYNSGKQDGYDEGYNLGKADGYENGYETGVEASLGRGYTLRDPTYREVITFLRKDETDENKYEEDTYICSHFARDVCNNAEASGLRCAIVLLRYPGGGHSLIAFDTIDKGLLFFEPQFDDKVKLVTGKRYSQQNGYEKPDYDDNIDDVLVVW